ncbi:MAG: globin-coupled sensor protein [Alphaproteobacteria bacterium]|nr:globin-coupled sensor protein [Alphaproteobacteria bacterium]
MTENTKTADLGDRLEFVGLDERHRRHLGALEPVIKASVGSALDIFYRKASVHPHTAKFFASPEHISHAKSRQASHWGIIAASKYDVSYVDAVTKVGEVHARIGLEPRWYIGGYAIILDGIIRAVIKEELKGVLHRHKAEQLSDGISAVVKAALVDMDYAISVYLDSLAHARAQTEAMRQAEQADQTAALGALRSALIGLAGGDLTLEIHEQLAPSFDGLKDNYNSSVQALEAAITELHQSVDEVRGEVDGIASAADNMAKRTEHQASALEESAAALEQITTISGQAAERAREVQEIVRESARETEQSGKVVEEAIAAMGDISASSQKMTQIIGVIDEIAFQTNLLALNAGVEAARAGEQGKGFAVVAQEVRELAQRSAAAAKEIKDLIDHSSTDVKRGVDLVNRTGLSLTTIGQRVSTISESINSITQSAQEQASGIEEINAAVRSMDEMTQQNAALMEETNASTQSLSQIASRLSALVSRFRTKSRNLDHGRRRAA